MRGYCDRDPAWHAGQIPVARDWTDVTGSLTLARADLAAGNLVVIYPEGSVTRDPDWWPMQARTGVARLALTTAVSRGGCCTWR